MLKYKNLYQKSPVGKMAAGRHCIQARCFTQFGLVLAKPLSLCSWQALLTSPDSLFQLSTIPRSMSKNATLRTPQNPPPPLLVLGKRYSPVQTPCSSWARYQDQYQRTPRSEHPRTRPHLSLCSWQALLTSPDSLFQLSTIPRSMSKNATLRTPQNPPPPLLVLGKRYSPVQTPCSSWARYQDQYQRTPRSEHPRTRPHLSLCSWQALLTSPDSLFQLSTIPRSMSKNATLRTPQNPPPPLLVLGKRYSPVQTPCSSWARYQDQCQRTPRSEHSRTRPHLSLFLASVTHQSRLLVPVEHDTKINIKERHAQNTPEPASTSRSVLGKRYSPVQTPCSSWARYQDQYQRTPRSEHPRTRPHLSLFLASVTHQSRLLVPVEHDTKINVKERHAQNTPKPAAKMDWKAKKRTSH